MKFLFISFLFNLFVISNFAVGQLNDFSTNYHNYYFNQYFEGIKMTYYTLRFNAEIVKGDSIMGFAEDFCAVSFNSGKDWEIIDIEKQTYDGKYDGNRNFAYPCLPNHETENNEGHIYLLNGDIVIYHRNKFFISKDWKTFKRVSTRNKSLDIDARESDGVNSFGGFKGYLHNDKFITINNGFMYISADCNSWNKFKLPNSGNSSFDYGFKLSISSNNNIIYFTNGIEFYKSLDDGKNWEKLEINYQFDFDKWDFLGDFFVFNDNLHVQCWILGKGFCHVIYNLKTNTHTVLEHIAYRYLYDDTLFLLERHDINSKGKLYYFKDSLNELNVDLSELDTTSFKNFRRFSLSDKIIVVDGSGSIIRRKRD
jgi:hypothetical protein